jgi:hypothetical protein
MDHDMFVAFVEQHAYNANLHLQTAMIALEVFNFSECLWHLQRASEQAEKAISLLNA